MREGRTELECVLTADDYPYLSQYVVDGRRALPAATAIELALAAVASVLDRAEGFELRNLRVADPEWFDASETQLRCALAFEGDGSAQFRIETPSSAGMRQIAAGRAQVATHSQIAAFEIDRAASRDAEPWSARISLGDVYRTAVRKVVTTTADAVAELEPAAAARFAAEGYAVHPVVWQLAIEMARAVCESAAGDRTTALVAGKVALLAAARPISTLHVRRDGDRVQVALIDAADGVVATLEDLQFERAAASRPAPSYTLHWREAEALQPVKAGVGSWLVIGASPLAAALGARLALQGKTCLRLTGAAAASFGLEVAQCVRDHGITHIVYAAEDIDARNGALSQPLSAAWAVLSESVAAVASSGARVWVVTQTACALDRTEVDRPQQAALWSFAGVLSLELPKAWGGLIDVSSAPGKLEIERVLQEIESGSEDRVALRGSTRFLPRLSPTDQSESSTALQLRSDATYLVTGGLGGLGLEVAQRLADRGARYVVLLGRTRDRETLEPEIAAKLRRLEQSGVRVCVVRADVADLGAMTQLARRFEQELPRLSGIVHTAGVVQLGAAASQAEEDFARVARAKVDGTLVLEHLFPPATLDFFVCFSSGASVWGSRGLAAYAAGGGFMDAWARSHARNGARTLALNWGMWARVGMSAGEERSSLLASIGLRAMEPEAALDAMEQAMLSHAAQRVITDIDWSIFRRVYEANAPRRKLLCEVDAPVRAGSFADTRSQVRELLMQLTGLASEAMDSDAPLNTLGIDSISGLDLQARVLQTFGCKLDVSEIMQGATVDDVIDRVWRMSSEAAAGSAPKTEHTQTRIPARAAGAPACMSFPQERLWFLEQLAPGAAIYNVPGVIRVRGEFEPVALREALELVAARHAVLRTSFDVSDGAPLPVLHEQVELPYAFYDLSNEASDWRVLARDEARKPFDLSRAPLLRLLVLRLAAADHIVVLTLHHMVADAWSLAVLVQELHEIQVSFRSSQPLTRPPLPIQFADYAAWQRARLARGDLDAGLAYWVRELEHAPRLLELPTDFPRPAVRTGAGAITSLVLPAEVARALRACAKRHAVTPFAVCLAMYATLLHKYSRQSAVCVGVPVAGRDQPETRALIGFFVNTIVLCTDFAANPDLSTLFARVMTATANGLAHQDVPFEHVVAALRPTRDASHTPLFQAGLAFQNVPRTALNTLGQTLELVDLDPGISKFDLHLTILERGDTYECALEYSSDLFEQETAQQMLGHWSSLLLQAAGNPELRVDDISLTDAAEREQVVRRWNQTAANYGSEQLLHRLIEAQAARTPERTAVVFRSTTLTYAELDRRSNRLAWRLRGAGIGPGDFVGVYMERSAELVVALLAILKSGAAYVPFDPSYPRTRLELLASDVDPRLILTHEPLRNRRLFERAWFVELDALATGEGVECLPDAAASDSPAYMIHTSGSTGTPKGALNSHRAICNRLHWMQAEMKLDASDVVLQKTPIGFDVSVWELFWPLIAGACELIAEPGGHRDPGYLAELIASQGVTTLHFVPSMLHSFLEERGIERLSSVRRMVCSGEALSRDLHDRSLRCWPHAKLYNLYGPAEAAVDVSYWECSLEDGRRDVPIGRPIANTQLYVLDAALNPLPVGVPGELHIGGIQVGLGYHRRPELTREKFVRDPFSGDASARLYRTGDLARWHRDGTLEFLGRIDQQIKLQGCRVEPGEVEAVLRSLPAVSEAAVVVRSTGQHSPNLVAYVVLDREGTSGEELQQALRTKLPEFMVPSFVVVLAELPRSANGKLDRLALPAPEPVLRATMVRARDETERAVATLWCELLGRDDIGVLDNFFEIGGHSLLAARLAARISRRFETRISVAALLGAPTIAQMAALLRDSRRGDEITVEFGPASTAPTLFLIHPAAGDASCYSGIARRLRSHARVIGLRSPALTGGTLHRDIPSMAREYLSALRKLQPTGPYWLGGWSMGAAVAFEMATQLQHAGERVSRLIVIDGAFPSDAVQALLNEASLVQAFVRDFAAMFGIRAPEISLPVDDVLHDACLAQLGQAAPSRNEIALRRNVYAEHCKAMFAYRPKPLPLRLALILSKEGAAAESAFGSWSSVVDDASKLVLDADHYSLIHGEHLPGVAKFIQHVLLDNGVAQGSELEQQP